MNTKITLLLVSALIAVAVLFPQAADRLPREVQANIPHSDELPAWVAQSFAQWKAQYSKRYGSSEVELYRMAVYYANFLHIQAENARQSEYVLAANEFMDMTPEEWAAQYLITPPERPRRTGASASLKRAYVPPNKAFNWEDKEVVGPVLNQGSCGSCWAFSATETVQSFIGITTGTVPQLSEQQLVDCSTYLGNEGCNGGWPSYGLEYVKAHGQATTEEYPYTARDAKCKLEGGSTHIQGVRTSEGCDELTKNIDIQPTSVCVDASNWSFYRSGVFSNCAKNINHAVLAIGYTDGGDWILRNSWGATWGQNGNIVLKSGDTCAVCQVLANVY